MNRTLLLVTLLLMLSSPSYAGLKEGKDAYKKKNWFQAILNLRPLVEEGNTEAMVLLGNMYSDGLGVKKTPSIAFEHYKKAAELGNKNAMLSVGALMLEGAGTETNIENGLEWIIKAANHNSQDAQFFLAYMYLKGLKKSDLNIPEDKEKSYFWFKLASMHRPMKKREQSYNAMAQQVAADSLTTEQRETVDQKIKAWVSEDSRLHPKNINKNESDDKSKD